MVFVSLAFVAGVFFLQHFSTLPAALWSVPVVIVAIPLLVWGKWRLFAWFLLGWSWALLFASLVLYDSLDPAIEGENLIVEGQVVGIPQSFDRGLRFNFIVERVHGQAGRLSGRQIRLSWYSPTQSIRSGERWRFQVRLKRPHGTFNPGGFDYEQWLYLQGFSATGYVRKQVYPICLDDTGETFSIDRFRQSIAEAISTALKESPLNGVIQALVVGDRHGITLEQWEVFRKTGTSHLVAISGLHVGLVAGFGFFLANGVWVRWGSRTFFPASIAAGFALLCAVIYSAMAGFSLPTQRALIMIGLVMGSVILRGKLLPGNTLAVALLIIVAIDPNSVLSPGLWLSFSAVALITYILAGRIGVTGRWSGIQKIQLVTAVGLMPLLLLYFQQVSVIAPLANLVAVPTVSLLVVPVCLLGGILILLFPNVGSVVLSIGADILELLWRYLQWLSELPIAQWTGGQPSVFVLVLAALALLLLFAPRGVPGRLLAIPMMLPLVFMPSGKPAVGALHFTLLDVGQGLAAVVETANHTLVFDTGARYSKRFDMGSAVVAPFLRNRNITRIDSLVISHADNDHIGGAQSLSQMFPIDRILSSRKTSIDWAPADDCKAGQIWHWDGVFFEMLAPLTKFSGQRNENSCVLKIQSPYGNILLTGDIEKGTEAVLVERYGKKMRSDYLVVAHHGSNTSSTIDFLRAVNPQYALVPAGYRNRYRFPRPEVIQRLQKIGAKIYNTANSGAILIQLGPQNLGVPIRYRAKSGKYYNFAVDGL